MADDIRRKRRKHHKSKRRAHRRARRRKRRRARREHPQTEDVTQLMLLQLLQQMYGRHAKPPVDPYARGGKVAPLPHAAHVSAREYNRAAAAPGPAAPDPNAAPPAWGP